MFIGIRGQLKEHVRVILIWFCFIDWKENLL